MKSLLLLVVFLHTSRVVAQNQLHPQFIELLPKGYELVQTLTGDLNNDGLSDLVLVIQATDIMDGRVASKNVPEETNRRGL